MNPVAKRSSGGLRLDWQPLWVLESKPPAYFQPRICNSVKVAAWGIGRIDLFPVLRVNTKCMSGRKKKNSNSNSNSRTNQLVRAEANRG